MAYVNPYEKYAAWTKAEKEAKIKKLDEELAFIHKLDSDIRKSEVMDLTRKNLLIKEMDERAKEIYYERKLLTGRF